MRNPFQFRASQRFVSDEEFVKLFGAGALQLLSEVKQPWDGLVFLRSAPGGGKTTFLRLLTPRPLALTSRLMDASPQVKATYEALRGVGAIDENGSALLGTMVVFTNEYRDLDEIDLSNGFFRALLNARIVIATLRSVLEWAGRPFPEDLHRFEFAWDPESAATIPAKANGEELFLWASEIERSFYRRVDEFDEPDDGNPGHARLDALKWFARSSIRGAGGELQLKRVLLFDELQTLSKGQHASLSESIAGARETCGVWIAERLEALPPDDLLSEGALRDRDFEGVIYLEHTWGGKRAKTYVKFVDQIAELRARKADGFENRDFLALLADAEDGEVWDRPFEAASAELEAELSGARDAERYGMWIEEARRHKGTAVERAVRWRSMKILIERDRSRPQAAFQFDQVPTSEYDKREKAVEKAAEHMLRVELKAPVYFGRETVAAVSSSNVDQYIEVAGALFEEVSAKIKGRRDPSTPLTAERQDAIIRKVADTRWTDLTRRLPRGYDARRFLQGIVKLCQDETFRPTAPYAPGVTGFGITLKDREALVDEPAGQGKALVLLRDVLTSLVAHNLLSPRLDHQNNGQSHVVFYLNRLLCVQFNLPLGYGGWRRRSLRDLQGMLTHGAADPSLSKGSRLV